MSRADSAADAADASGGGAARAAADRHDVIRVHAARVNNLRDVGVELPKRRLTVFTGVSVRGRARWPSARWPRSRSG